jgi:hypothetical protein
VEEYFTVLIHQIFKTHLSANGHLGCFNIMATMNNAAMNMSANIPLP